MLKLSTTFRNVLFSTNCCIMYLYCFLSCCSKPCVTINIIMIISFLTAYTLADDDKIKHKRNKNI